MGRLLEGYAFTCWGVGLGFLKCPMETPTPLAPEEAPARRESRGRRKEGSAPRDPAFSVARRRPFGPLPPSVSLSPPPASRAKPLILREELHLWPRQTDAATCNLLSPRYFPSAQPLSRGSQSEPGVRPAGWESWVCSLLAGRIWELTGPLCTSFICNMGVITVFTAWGGVEDQTS